ncbi:hypothetical protein FRC03_012759 [Tulasnella sp. 419]|nr:hypothetical protein FRC03_012759 [Tulasnella sp. 419]
MGQQNWCCLRTATLILSGLGACANFYASAKLVSIWFSFRWTSWGSDGESSEWEGYAWSIDTARALGAIICAYFFVGGIASIVGFVGTLKRRTSNLRLFRDYSIADLAFGFTCTTLFTFASTQPSVRSMLCEELSRQPDLLRSLSESAGLTVENCEGFIDKAVVGVVLALFVGLFIRLQFTLTVINYYTHLKRTQQHHHSSSRRSQSHRHSRSSSQRIVLLSSPLPSSSLSSNPSSSSDGQQTVVYAPVNVSLEQARKMNGRDALLFSKESDLESGSDAEGAIRLPIIQGEEPWRGPRYRDEKV